MPMQMKPAIKMIRNRLNDGKPPNKKATAKAKATTKKKTSANKLIKPSVSKARAELEAAKKKPMTRNRAALLKMREGRHDASDVGRQRTREKFRKEQALIELARKRRAQGLPPAENITIKVSAHQRMALQVRAGNEKQWATIVGFKYYPGTPHMKRDCTCKDCLSDVLKAKQVGWQTSQYFGADAQFRVEEVTVPAQVINTGKTKPTSSL